MKRAGCLLGFILSSCIVVDGPRRPLPPPPPPVEAPPVIEESVYVEPPIEAPPPIAVRCAPPPMRVEPPPPPPYLGAVWVGGYWHWYDGQWVWFQGRWMLPPQPQYVWFVPYYENRDGLVIYVAGHWARAGVPYSPPPPNVYIPVSESRPGYVGYRPQGPSGVFVPPPPGSRPGVIVPAPLGTPPGVVVSAPPVVRPGMTIQHNNVSNVPNTTNGTHVTILAPPGVTQTGRPVETTIPADAHPAASLPAVVHAPPPAPNQFGRPESDAPHGFGQAGRPIPASDPSNSSFHPEHPLHPEHPDHPEHPEHPSQADHFAQPRPPIAQPPTAGPTMIQPAPAPTTNQAQRNVEVRHGMPQPVARSPVPVEQERNPKRGPPDNPGNGRGKEKKDRFEKEDRSKN